MDRDLVVRAREGDRDDFARLAAAAIVRLDGPARLITRDAERAKDADQEALRQRTFQGRSGAAVEHGPPSETHQRIVVLDADGQRVVLDTWTRPDTSSETVAEAERVRGSIDFH